MASIHFNSLSSCFHKNLCLMILCFSSFWFIGNFFVIDHLYGCSGAQCFCVIFICTQKGYELMYSPCRCFVIGLWYTSLLRTLKHMPKFQAYQSNQMWCFVEIREISTTPLIKFIEARIISWHFQAVQYIEAINFIFLCFLYTQTWY